jgi:hypothetical protein
MLSYLASYVWRATSTTEPDTREAPPLPDTPPITLTNASVPNRLIQHTPVTASHCVNHDELLLVKNRLRPTQTIVYPARYPSRIPYIEEMRQTMHQFE